MKQIWFRWCIATAAVMLLLPWLVVTFVKGDAGMAILFLLFYAINPIYSIVVGIFAGKRIQALWSLPLLPAILFLLGIWLLFTLGEPLFLLYTGVYLAMGVAAMLVSARSSKRT